MVRGVLEGEIGIRGRECSKRERGLLDGERVTRGREGLEGGDMGIRG